MQSTESTVKVAFDAQWLVTAESPIGTVRRFDEGWGLALSYVAAHRATLFVGARVPSSPTRVEFDDDGERFEVEELNWGIDEKFIEAAVRGVANDRASFAKLASGPIQVTE